MYSRKQSAILISAWSVWDSSTDVACPTSNDTMSSADLILSSPVLSSASQMLS
jgi:hypothetical protein